MSSQTIQERLPATGIGIARTSDWLKLNWKAFVGKKKRLVLGLTALTVGGAPAFFFFGNQASAAQYMTAKTERGSLRNTVTATGTLQAVTTVQVGSQSSGAISALYADFNSVVKKGEGVGRID